MAAKKKAGAAKAAKPAKKGFSAEERAAMKEAVSEMKGGGEGEDAVLAKIAKMPEPDRSLARRVHTLVMAAAPTLAPRLWYGMPAYSKDGKVLCFFQDANKFKARYATLGFSDKAALDDGQMWPTTFALASLGAHEADRITALVKQAVG